MSYRLFGASHDLGANADARVVLSTIPGFEGAGRPITHAYFVGIREALIAEAKLADVIAERAEARPTPPSPLGLQELVAAGRTALARERSRRDKDLVAFVRAHVEKLEEKLRP